MTDITTEIDDDARTVALQAAFDGNLGANREFAEQARPDCPHMADPVFIHRTEDGVHAFTVACGSCGLVRDHEVHQVDPGVSVWVDRIVEVAGLALMLLVLWQVGVAYPQLVPAATIAGWVLVAMALVQPVENVLWDVLCFVQRRWAER